MSLFSLWFYVAFSAAGALLVATYSALIHFETARFGALQCRIHRIALPASICLLLSNALLCVFVYYPSSHVLQVAIDILRDGNVLCADYGIAIVGYTAFQTALFNIGLEIRRDVLTSTRAFLIGWLSIETLLFLAVHIARPISNLESPIAIYFIYWCAGMLSGCAFVAYAVHALYYAVAADMRQRLKFPVAVACVYVVLSFATALVAAGATVFFLSHYSTLVYFGHDQARLFQAATPIASVVILSLAAAPSMHAMCSSSGRPGTSRISSDASALRIARESDDVAVTKMAPDGDIMPSLPAWLVPATHGAPSAAEEFDLTATDGGGHGALPLLGE